MPWGSKIRKRTYFVDRLTVTEVGLFVGLDARTIKRKYAALDATKNESGWWIWSVSSACKTFRRVTGRIPRGEEIANLMDRMGADLEEIDGMILKLYAQGLSKHKTKNGYLLGD